MLLLFVTRKTLRQFLYLHALVSIAYFLEWNRFQYSLNNETNKTNKKIINKLYQLCATFFTCK